MRKLVRKPIPGTRYIMVVGRAQNPADYNRFSRAPEQREEEVLFVGEVPSDTSHRPGEIDRQFQSINPQGTPYTWESYLYSGRWCLGSGATPIALYREQAPAEIELAGLERTKGDLKVDIGRLERNITLMQEQLTKQQQHLTRVNVLIADLKEIA